MIPDYLRQVQDIECNLEAQSEVSKPVWIDDVAKRFYEKFMKKYTEDIHNYLYKDFLTGKGLDQLLQFFDEKQREIGALSGVFCEVQPVYDAEIGYVSDADYHPETEYNPDIRNSEDEVGYNCKERRYYEKENVCAYPGDLDTADVSNIMYQRNHA